MKTLAVVLVALAIGTSAAKAEVLTVEAPNGKLSLSGTVLLFDYIPSGLHAQQKFEVYAFMLNVDAETEDGQMGLHGQARFRDSKLRPFFLSNQWFQSLYVFRKTPVADIHVGKFYRNVGILWDDSFFGNVQYFNGLKLQPDYGAEAVKTQNFGDRFAMDWSAQFFPNNDKVDGSLNGRDVESDPNATMHNTSTFRLVPTVKFGEKSSLAIGLSGLHQQIVRPVLIGNSFSINQYAADATVTAGPLIAYVEGLKQNGELNDAAHPLSRPGYDTATYLLAGARYQVVKWLNARMNYSQARYKGQNAREEEYVPGLVFTLDKNSYIMTEFDYWIINPAVGPNVLIDRSYNVIFGYNF